MIYMLNEASFLRPLALWLLLLLPLVYIGFQRRSGFGRNPWRSLVDKQLMPTLFPQTAAASPGNLRPRLHTVLACLGWVLFVLALSGPSLHSAEVPTVTPRAEAVVVVGLPESILAQDLTPDRLTRSRIAIEEWLTARSGDEIGLIAFAGSAYRVSPLTRDTRTLKHLLHSLQPDVMPRPGNDLGAGIEAAVALFSSGPGARTLLLVTDGNIPPATAKTLAALVRQGYRIQVMGVGTPGGAPIPLANGRFAMQRDGQLQLATTNLQQQKQAVSKIGGQWVDVRDYNASRWQDAPAGLMPRERDNEHRSSVPQDDGVWLLLPLMLLLAAAFRRGALWLLLAACLPLTHPGAAIAAEVPDWLLNTEQRTVRAWQRAPGPDTAQAIPNDQWRGVAEFSGGDYAAAEQSFAAGTSINDRYNQALALAYQDRIDDAIAGFREVLEEQPEFAAARKNLELLEQLRQQQQESEQQDGEGESSDESDSEENDSSEGNESEASGEQSQDKGQPSEDEQQGSSSDSQPADAEATADDGQPQDPQGEEAEDNAEGAPQPDTEEQSAEAESTSLTANPSEQEEAERTLRQWLRRVDSDPARLLRERFRRLEIERQRGANARDDGR